MSVEVGVPDSNSASARTSFSMSRLVVLDSDWHASNFPQFAQPAPAGLNTRMLDQLSVRRQVLEWCRHHHPVARITGGDEFHTPGLTGTLDVAVSMAVIDVEAEFDELGIPIVKLVGNHDQSTRSGEAHALAGFKGANLRVAEIPTWYDLDQLWVLAIPYSRDPEVIRAALSARVQVGLAPPILTVVHYEMDGAVVETGWRVTSPVTHENLPTYGWVWFGHHHTHQMWTKRTGVIGTPLQHTRSDEGSSKGFIVVDLDKNTFKRVPTDAPKFLSLTWAKYEEMGELPHDGSFWRVTHVPATRAHELRRQGVVIEAEDEDPEDPEQTVAVTVSDLSGSLRRYYEAGLVTSPDPEISAEEIYQFSADVLERALAGDPTIVTEETANG
jgi:hypothetical protein